MNRAERRQLTKQGASPETVSRLDQFQSPCSIAEAVQISRATAEDVVEGALMNYQRNHSPLQIALSLQVEILKDTLIKAGLLTEKQFKEAYVHAAEEFNKLQRDYASSDETPMKEETPIMEVKPNDITVDILED